MDNYGALDAVLTNIRSASRTERDKGTAFERLVKTYLKEDALWGAKFSDVWMWSEWPGRDGRGDAGIDLVAEEADTGDLWAIQAKFYDPGHTLQKGDIDSFFTESGKSPFASRMIVSTTDHWSANAEKALDGQHIPVTRLRLMDLADTTLDWSTYTADQASPPQHFEARSLRPHQQEALNAVDAGFQAGDRGKLIMACGTGKTFTALRIAEDLAGAGGRVLFLVPSISLLQQTLREWTNHATVPLKSFAVCSDSKIGKKNEDISVHDLQYPATTNAARLAQHASVLSEGSMTVVFATYQSIQVVAEAQLLGLPKFDLIICDEAHRTTGVTLADADESNFVRVHDSNYIKGAKRLYMTATPRIYTDDSKSKADEAGAVVASMDDEAVYGPEFHRLGFGEAVERDLLSDYKVLVLAVDEAYIARAFQQQLSDENNELKLDDAAKIVGCWNGLSKRRVLQTGPDGELLEDPENIDDAAPMSRAVAFTKSIKDSKRLTDMFSEIVNHYTATSDDPDLLRCQTEHVDGTFNVLDRNARLDWLKAEPPDNTCRILSNARCLSEGVDVPALDAVLFLNPRNSTVDVVQSVGRVMRKHPEKKYGYVILPIGIPAGMTPEEALADHARYKVVWQVLQALRAHDDRFNAMVNKIELNRAGTDTIQVIGVGGGPDAEEDDLSSAIAPMQTAFAFPQMDQWRDAILAKLVQKVGDRRYWEDWAKDIAHIADRHVTRITAILDNPGKGVSEEFDSFLMGLRGNLNDSITRADAIEMLAQHLITKPVFDALFEDYSFAAENPVSQVMQGMLDALNEHSLETESATLDKFYESVRMRASGIDNAEGKQRIIVELYDKFFRNAFPQMADKLGIVYTPIEVVDYMLRSVQEILRSEFESDLSDEGVHILDPFTGTGTFITRLIDSGLIAADALERKYRKELHANEIVLLAYYIAAINIEATYHGVHGGRYESFDGIVLVDTFQMYEDGDPDDSLVFPINNERLQTQRRAPIRVIVGNPPYSERQSGANEANQNVKYGSLDERISQTYVRESTSTTRTSVYDSYFRAFRLAADRLADKGVVAFVTNATWIDSLTADGFRKSISREFDAIYVVDLRGNSRLTTVESRREGENVFPIRTPVAITFLVRNPKRRNKDTVIKYCRMPDGASRTDKLELLRAKGSISSEDWQEIRPNPNGDWINQRRQDLSSFLPLGDRGTKGRESQTIFTFFSQGMTTNRDSWSVNFDKEALARNMQRMIGNYNQMLDEYIAGGAPVDNYVRVEKSRIAWVENLIRDFRNHKRATFDPSEIALTLYRPFTKEYVYKQKQMIWSAYRVNEIFPPGVSDNIAILLSGPASSKGFSVLAVNQLFDYNCLARGYAFPRARYVVPPNEGLFDEGLERRSAISKWARAKFADTYAREFTDEQIFAYVFGILSSRQFQNEFAVELAKELPRVPLVVDPEPYVAAGNGLIRLQTQFEEIDPWPLSGLPGNDVDPARLHVQRMTFVKDAPEHPRSAVRVNASITLEGIPEDAYRYVVNGRPAIEWLMDRYQVKPDKASGIVNDPNAYSDDPRYIIDLVARVVRVSMESVAIIDGLPPLEIID